MNSNILFFILSVIFAVNSWLTQQRITTVSESLVIISKTNMQRDEHLHKIIKALKTENDLLLDHVKRLYSQYNEVKDEQ